MSLCFAILVTGQPYSDQSSQTALDFCKAIIERHHTIYRVFFFNDGVHCANRLITPPQDETSISKQWLTLQGSHNLDMVVCVSSALRRGIIDQKEAERYNLDSHNMSQGFSIGGLGQWVDACINADRIIRFGS
ncbi:Putative sulfurtransferase DsrE [Zhongshania aliphaticivorans]|uniref:Sulfurtransferase DsrE n=1 Tax=Zhongshania aliphaticivorans TaxID=1470434 RepID=A0A5S9NG41_9GAMM|nr:sulfurtransferase complex subunit TusD [Zhongshania aliphaticivorans]CAA0089422.1 Putative sulfurtransferase DsrE [Zhongshania aliphaticivorans]CAA0096196.1 Putative sulfurtransferase DsrE [Zhongshania aliphaticivorans]